MQKLLVVLVTVLFSAMALTQFKDSVIEGVQLAKLETALRRNLQVYSVKVVEAQEKKIENALDDLLAGIDPIFADSKAYSMKMNVAVKENLLSRAALHVVTCDVVDLKKQRLLLLQNCMTENNPVGEMLLKKSDLN